MNKQKKTCNNCIYKNITEDSCNDNTTNDTNCDYQTTNNTLGELFEKLKSAVVVINATYTSYTCVKNKCNTSNNSNSCSTSISRYIGSGFLINYNESIYICTCAHVVLHSTGSDPMTEISCGIYNVNGSRKNLVYKLKLVGIDVSADFAILKIDGCDYKLIPNVKCHPTIKFGNNLDVTGSTQVFNVSNTLNKDIQSLTVGNIRDNLWFDPTGVYVNSCLLTTLLVYPSSSGSPVLDTETGECYGIIGFGFVGEDKVQSIGFGGGCDAYTMKIIIDNILNKKSVVPITGKNGTKYLANTPGYLGNITYSRVSSGLLINYTPNNYKNLEIQGAVILKQDPTGPLSNLLGDSAPLKAGDFIIWTKFNGQLTVIGSADYQAPFGYLLWQINPADNANNILTLGIIRNPQNNSKIEIAKARLDQIQDPATTSPPQSGVQLFDIACANCSPDDPGSLACILCWP